MLRVVVLAAVALTLLPGAPARAAPPEVMATYDTYAAGLNVAEVQVGLGLSAASYEVRMAYHTTGFAGFFLRGHQLSEATGTWHGDLPVPHRFSGEGVWRGQQRVISIDYQNGSPLIRALVPPNDGEREAVPPASQANTIDTLSALVELIRRVASTRRCDATARTYDGRRLVEIRATTVGEEMLAADSRSSFSGSALRCDFSGKLLAGYLHGDSRPAKPMLGSAWLARVVPDAPPVPVRLAFETRWFGDATMYLRTIKVGPQPVAVSR